MSTKPSRSESEFFAREEAEKIHRLAEQQKREQLESQKEQSKNIHFMKCPKCGSDLKTVRMGLVDVEECSECEVLVLDKDALKKIEVADKSIFKSLLEVFRTDD
jgi:ribosomal protein L37AE/L43A